MDSRTRGSTALPRYADQPSRIFATTRSPRPRSISGHVGPDEAQPEAKVGVGDRVVRLPRRPARERALGRHHALLPDQHLKRPLQGRLVDARAPLYRGEGPLARSDGREHLPGPGLLRELRGEDALPADDERRGGVGELLIQEVPHAHPGPPFLGDLGEPAEHQLGIDRIGGRQIQHLGRLVRPEGLHDHLQGRPPVEGPVVLRERRHHGYVRTYEHEEYRSLPEIPVPDLLQRRLQGRVLLHEVGELVYHYDLRRSAGCGGQEGQRPVPRLEGHAPAAHYVGRRQLRARNVLREQLELTRERLPGGGKEHVRHRRMGTPPQELVHEARLPDPPPPPHGDETAAARLPHPVQLGLQGRHVAAPADEVAHLLSSVYSQQQDSHS